MEFTIGISKPGLRKLASDINSALDGAGEHQDVQTTTIYIKPENARSGAQELVLNIGGEDFADAEDGQTYFIR